MCTINESMRETIGFLWREVEATPIGLHHHDLLIRMLGLLGYVIEMGLDTDGLYELYEKKVEERLETYFY